MLRTEVPDGRAEPTWRPPMTSRIATRLAITAVNLGTSGWSGLQTEADAIAEAITTTAGLSPLPPRPELVNRNRVWIMLVVAALCLGLGLLYGPLLGRDAGLPFAARVVGTMLLPIGVGMLGQSFRITRDHRRKRRQHPTDGR